MADSVSFTLKADKSLLVRASELSQELEIQPGTIALSDVLGLMAAGLVQDTASWVPLRLPMLLVWTEYRRMLRPIRLKGVKWLVQAVEVTSCQPQLVFFILL